jgi:hypothetical protein
VTSGQSGAPEISGCIRRRSPTIRWADLAQTNGVGSCSRGLLDVATHAQSRIAEVTPAGWVRTFGPYARKLTDWRSPSTPTA